MGLTMNKLTLAKALKESQNLSKAEAAKCVELFFNALSDALSKGHRVEIRGLCSFQVKEYRSYTGRNPKTGKKVTVKAKKMPTFKIGTQLKQRVNG
jgi:integration host factor subunit beta